MEKISPSLQKKIDAARPEEGKIFNLIITLSGGSDWDEGVRLVKGAGLQIDSTAEEIRAISGRAETKAILRIAEVPAVELVEIDEQASAMS